MSTSGISERRSTGRSTGIRSRPCAAPAIGCVSRRHPEPTSNSRSADVRLRDRHGDRAHPGRYLVYVRVASDLSSSIDDGLRTRIDDLARALQSDGAAEANLGRPGDEGAEDVLTEVLTPDGRVLDSSEGRASEPALDRVDLTQARGGLTFFDATEIAGVEGDARLIARPVQTDAGTVVAIVGALRATARRPCQAWSPRLRSVVRWPSS